MRSNHSALLSSLTVVFLTIAVSLQAPVGDGPVRDGQQSGSHNPPPSHLPMVSHVDPSQQVHPTQNYFPMPPTYDFIKQAPYHAPVELGPPYNIAYVDPPSLPSRKIQNDPLAHSPALDLQLGQAHPEQQIGWQSYAGDDNPHWQVNSHSSYLPSHAQASYMMGGTSHHHGGPSRARRNEIVTSTVHNDEEQQALERYMMNKEDAEEYWQILRNLGVDLDPSDSAVEVENKTKRVHSSHIRNPGQELTKLRKYLAFLGKDETFLNDVRAFRTGRIRHPTSSNMSHPSSPCLKELGELYDRLNDDQGRWKDWQFDIVSRAMQYVVGHDLVKWSHRPDIFAHVFSTGPVKGEAGSQSVNLMMAILKLLNASEEIQKAAAAYLAGNHGTEAEHHHRQVASGSHGHQVMEQAWERTHNVGQQNANPNLNRRVRQPLAAVDLSPHGIENTWIAELLNDQGIVAGSNPHRFEFATRKLYCNELQRRFLDSHLEDYLKRIGKSPSYISCFAQARSIFERDRNLTPVPAEGAEDYYDPIYDNDESFGESTDTSLGSSSDSSSGSESEIIFPPPVLSQDPHLHHRRPYFYGRHDHEAGPSNSSYRRG